MFKVKNDFFHWQVGMYNLFNISLTWMYLSVNVAKLRKMVIKSERMICKPYNMNKYKQTIYSTLFATDNKASCLFVPNIWIIKYHYFGKLLDNNYIYHLQMFWKCFISISLLFLIGQRAKYWKTFFFFFFCQKCSIQSDWMIWRVENRVQNPIQNMRSLMILPQILQTSFFYFPTFWSCFNKSFQRNYFYSTF